METSTPGNTTSPSLGQASKPSVLGHLSPIPVRDYWPDEARDFTPWLAQESNLKLLGETIELDLEPFKIEEQIGPFRADIVAKEGDGLVIIENQLGQTDHKHLGQLMVYATNREATAVVWIATKVTDEYRKVLDWLNDNTPNTISFFGLEIELWKIGDSAAAPRFNVVCEPNELTKLERGSTSLEEPTETKLLQLEFWRDLKSFAEEKGSSLSFRKPKPQHWYSLAVGRSGFHISLNTKSTAKELSCELYIAGRVGAELAFELLEEDKEEIENSLGKLEWMDLPGKGACRIVQRRAGDIGDDDARAELLDWCLARAEAFHKAFSQRVPSLDLDAGDTLGEPLPQPEESSS
jgi:uncharacterized protein DUF4268